MPTSEYGCVWYVYPKEEKHHIGSVVGVDCNVEAGYGVQLRAVESLGRSGYTPLTTTHTNAFFLLPFTTRYPCQCNFNIKLDVVNSVSMMRMIWMRA